MKQILLALLGSFALSAGATNELDLELNKYYKSNGIVVKNEKVDDYTLIRRIYIDLAGRIPNEEEINSFVKYKNPNKVPLLADKILNSEDFVNNYYNFWADLLRIKPERLGDAIQMKSYLYMELVRNFIRSDIPYNQFVYNLLSATGKITDNPYSSYFIRDDGMAFDNLAITNQIFIGKSHACNICHDSPFTPYTQKQFYEQAALLTNNNRENRKDYRDILKKVDEEIKIITKSDRPDNQVRQLMSSNLFNIQDDPNKQIKYPPNYAYDNAKPGEVAIASSIDGKFKDVKQDKRKTFAKWVVEHEDFSVTAAARIWENIVGNNLFSPQQIIDFDKNVAKNKEIVIFLGNYFKNNKYSTKSLVKLIVSSDFYLRKAYIGTLEAYQNQALLAKRLNSHQIWDSILSLILEDVNYSKVSFGKYADLFEINWEEINGQKLLDQVERIKSFEKELNDSFLKYQGVDLTRSSLMLNRNNGFVATFLKEFGASDRTLIDSSDNQGNITQLLTLMNSPLISIITDKKSKVIQYYEKNNRDKEAIFISIMGRPISIFERNLIEGAKVDDLIWALLNSKRFLFRI